MVENATENRNEVMISVNASVKNNKTKCLRRRSCLNLSLCACESDKHCEIDKYLKNFASMKSLLSYSVIKCDEIAGRPENTSNDFIDKKEDTK